jgi:hypothetical protein
MQIYTYIGIQKYLKPICHDNMIWRKDRDRRSKVKDFIAVAMKFQNR